MGETNLSQYMMNLIKKIIYHILILQKMQADVRKKT